MGTFCTRNLQILTADSGSYTKLMGKNLRNFDLSGFGRPKGRGGLGRRAQILGQESL